MYKKYYKKYRRCANIPVESDRSRVHAVVFIFTVGVMGEDDHVDDYENTATNDQPKPLTGTIHV